jgi:tetratricopeptide (TPR) repeat protein
MWAASNFLGRAYLCRGDVERAVPKLERSLQIAETADVPMLVINGSLWLGCAYTQLDRTPESIALLEQAKNMAETTRYMATAPFIYAHLGEAYAHAGRAQLAENSLGLALDLARERGMRAAEAWALYLQGNVEASRDAMSARPCYSSAVALAQELEMRPLEAQCRCALGQLALELGQSQDAREQLTMATAMFREMGMQSWLTRAESLSEAL